MEQSGSGNPRDLRAIVGDGVFFSAMVGLGEAYVPAFVLAAGLGEVAAGLVATLPMLAGAVLQLATPWGVRRMGSYRAWVVLCARLQAASFLPLLVGAALGRISLVWIGVSAAGYWAFGMATSPAWNTWVTQLVPVGIRAGFFARRTRAAQATLLAATLAGGFLLEAGSRLDSGLLLFALLFSVAMIARLVSARFLASQSEQPGVAAAHRALPPREILHALRAAGSTRVLAYLLGMHAAVNVAAPYFTPYMLGTLALSYAEFTLLIAVAFLARVAVLPLLGRIAHKRGSRPLLWWGAVGIVPLPPLWLVSHELPYLVVLQVLSGTAWAALEFATLLAFFEGIEERDRASILTAYNLGSALAISAGALIGSWVFASVGGAELGYVWLFALSSLGRVFALPVLRGAEHAERLQAMQLRTLAVRPSAGAIERPILATVDGERESDPDQPGV